MATRIFDTDSIIALAQKALAENEKIFDAELDRAKDIAAKSRRKLYQEDLFRWPWEKNKIFPTPDDATLADMYPFPYSEASFGTVHVKWYREARFVNKLIDTASDNFDRNKTILTRILNLAQAQAIAYDGQVVLSELDWDILNLKADK